MQEKRRELEKKRLQVRVESKEKKEMWELKQQFGGGTEGERLARTLMKLKSAYNEGLHLSTRKSLQYDVDYYDDDSWMPNSRGFCVTSVKFLPCINQQDDTHDEILPLS